MNRIAQLAGGISLAMGLAVMGAAVAAPDKVDRLPPDRVHSPENVRFFLADPELGLAGVYTLDGAEIYFEARRTVDAETGAPGALSLRVVDADARTLALAGEPYSPDWIPDKDEFQGEVLAKGGRGYADLLSGLGEALEGADVHPSLAAEKSGLADLAVQAAGTQAGRFPLYATVEASKSAAVDVAQIADFYLDAVQDVEVRRTGEGQLEASLGNGVVLLSTQQFVGDEPDAEGRMGRIDAYAMVKAADGFVMMAELGGDRIPKGWTDAMEIENPRDHNALAADFGRAATALNALAYSGKATKGISLSHASEQETMQRLAQGLASHLLPGRDKPWEQPLREAAPGSLVGDEAMQKASAIYRTYVQVWRKPFVIIAQHSGTRVGKRRYASSTSSSYSFQGYVYYCNHGTCATGSGMTYKCSSYSPRLTWYRMPVRYSGSGGHTCATGYWATGMYWRHNCHDDSSMQIRAVIGQSYSTTGGRCIDAWFHAYAPSCGWQ